MSDEPNKLASEAPAETEAAALVTDQAAVPEPAEPEATAAAEEATSAEVVESEPADVAEVASEAAPVEEASEVAEQAGAEDNVEAEEATTEEERAEQETDAEEDEAEVTEEAAEEEAVEEEAVEEEAVEEESAEVEPIEEVDDAEPDEIKMDWYILKVQSNREKSIAAALERKIAVEGLQEYFGEVVVPVEKVTEFKGGKKKVVNRKLYPGYIVVHMCINDDTWFAVRETSGIGDFTGSGGKPTPMLPHEVARIVQTEEEETEEAPKLNINFKIGDQVKVNDGNFESFEGEVSAIDEHSGRITVMINIFGRSTPVELEYWQVEQT